MAQGNGWGSFMQDWRVQVALYGICVFFCVYNAVDGVLEALSPERSALYVQSMGQTGYYALAVIRTVVLAITGVAFGRMVLRALEERRQ